MADHLPRFRLELSGERLKLVNEGVDPSQLSDVRDRPRLAAFIRKLTHPHRHREVSGAVLVDLDYVPIGHTLPYQGVTAAVMVEPRQIFTAAFLAGAAGVVLWHNHPSRSVEPSIEDHEITVRLRDAGEILGIRLLDHLIVGLTHVYHSMAEAERPVLYSFEDGDVVTPRLERVMGLPVDGRSVVAPKYRDPQTGKTWAGRGSRPRWLVRRLEEGHRLADFLIKP